MTASKRRGPAKIAVMGAGAVGCYYGGMLARGGHDVTLIGRPQNVDAIRRDGLDLETRSCRARVRLPTSSDASAVRGAELVLFCVKSTDTESAGAAIAPHLTPDARVLCLQNGVDNAERLQAVVACRVEPAVVYVAVDMAGPGHVRHHGRGELVVGRDTHCARLADEFARAGIAIELSDNVVGALWEKLIVNCAYNALSAITQLPYGPLAASEGIEDVMRDVVRECVAVAGAAGVRVPREAWQTVHRIAQTMPSQLSSTAQDLARGKRSEIDHLNGFVTRKGAALGVPAPVNRTLWALVKLLERRSQ
jgi:2-dehydropantoate 2-reductase